MKEKEKLLKKYMAQKKQKKLKIKWGHIKSEEIIICLEKKEKKHPRYGKHFSKEQRNKMSNIRIHLFKTGKIIHPMLNKKPSKETIEKFKIRRKTWIIPKKDTTIEVKIQNFLKQLGIEFFTHQYIQEIEHGYQCDVFIPSMNLVIECDGNYWHKYPTGRDIDNIRTKELIQEGFKVLRLWESEIRVMNINQFNKKIKVKGGII